MTKIHTRILYYMIPIRAEKKCKSPQLRRAIKQASVVPSSYIVANTSLAKKYIYYMDYIAFNIISSFTQEIELFSRPRRCNGHIPQHCVWLLLRRRYGKIQNLIKRAAGVIDRPLASVYAWFNCLTNSLMNAEEYI